MTSVQRHPAIADLQGLVGSWRMEALFPGSDGKPVQGGTCVFEWMQGGELLIQRTDVPGGAPASLCVIAVDPIRPAFLQHYFDSRGVVRLYEMTFGDGIWTLSRSGADFSSFDFAQRFVGHMEDAGLTIRGGWEKSFDGTSWQHDFELVYRRES